MRRYLMRAKMNPLENQQLSRIITKDLIGTNIGNMLFPYSIMRSLISEEVMIDTFGDANECDPDKINEQYDGFLLPLANAFREDLDFRRELKKLTQIIRKLTIPCIVIGTGLQTDLEADLSYDFSFDSDVYEFCSAVLEKSSTIGVRGEITAAYLKKLGFSENYVRVIGCPSLYLWGSELPLKMPKTLTQDARISFSYNGNHPKLFEFLERNKKLFPNYKIVLQEISELRLLYAGASVNKKNITSECYAKEVASEDFLNNKLISFVNVPSWLNYFSNVDYTVGSRIHGSIASILSGTPTLTITTDSRVRELVEYHNIPHISFKELGNRTLYDLYEMMDFTAVQRGHKERYLRYISFLNENGLCTVSVDKLFSKSAYFDEIESRTSLVEMQGVTPYIHIDPEKAMQQLEAYIRLADGKIGWYQKQMEKLGKTDTLNKGMKEWNEAKRCVLQNIENMNP